MGNWGTVQLDHKIIQTKEEIEPRPKSSVLTTGSFFFFFSIFFESRDDYSGFISFPSSSIGDLKRNWNS